MKLPGILALAAGYPVHFRDIITVTVHSIQNVDDVVD
jgi:hypothetical protein